MRQGSNTESGKTCGALSYHSGIVACFELAVATGGKRIRTRGLRLSALEHYLFPFLVTPSF